MASWRHEPQRLAGTWTGYRQAGVGWPPLWHPGPPSVAARQPPARWHGAGTVAQYLALDADGAWAELVRHEHLRTEEDRDATRRRLWACTVEERDIADLRTFEAAEACGLDPAALVDDDHGPCRELAAELRTEGFRGAVTPSAALPGTVNLTLFGGRREVLHDDPQLALGGGRPPRPDVYVVARELADDARAPARLLARTRLLGDPHVGLEGRRAHRRRPT